MAAIAGRRLNALPHEVSGPVHTVAGREASSTSERQLDGMWLRKAFEIVLGA